MNTLEGYVDTIVGDILPQTFWDKIFFKRYQRKRDELVKLIYPKFEIAAKSYHGIAIQNYLIVLEGKCMDVHGKRTKKINYTEVYNTSKQINFKP